MLIIKLQKAVMYYCFHMGMPPICQFQELNCENHPLMWLIFNVT